MIKPAILIFIGVLLFTNTIAQTKKHIETSDIDLFWKVYDKVEKIRDSTKAIQIIQNEYIDKGGPGLMAIRNYNVLNSADVFNSEDLYRMIKTHKAYLNSIRQRSMAIKSNFATYNLVFNKFKKLYPPYNYPKVYFTIGAMRLGGFNYNDTCVVIGTELAVGTKTSKTASLNGYFQRFAKRNQGALFLLTHEMVHTQQTQGYLQNMNLTSICIMEGSADFIADLLLNKKNTMPYTVYGNRHAEELKNLFIRDKLTNDQDTLIKWMYNASLYLTLQPDLGYYIGYKICESYYDRAKNKAQAIIDILNINYDDKNSVMNFYNESQFE